MHGISKSPCSSAVRIAAHVGRENVKTQAEQQCHTRQQITIKHTLIMSNNLRKNVR